MSNVLTNAGASLKPQHRTGLRITAALASALALAACDKKDPIAAQQTDNPQIGYEVLFHHAGCEIGRFTDDGHSVYVTICPSGNAATRSEYTRSCGKGCSETVPVQNVTDHSTNMSRAQGRPLFLQDWKQYASGMQYNLK